MSSSFIYVFSTLHTMIWSSKLAASLPSVRNVDNASATRCFPAAGWSTSKSNLNNPKLHCASLQKKHDKFSFHVSESWSVRILKRVPLRYRRSSNTAQRIAIQSCCVVSCSRSALVKKCDHYLIAFLVLSGCSCNSTDPAWAWQSLVCRVNRPSK